ncbi:MAG: GSCFA domain-containing protein [Saprospiraceae bacterium]|nr:GSCFA domain-containing protein [Saprospiraceae bacterium]
MEPFRTKFPKIESSFSINHYTKILCFGSCFANELFHSLKLKQFQTMFSPFGICFNPLSLMDQLKNILSNNYISNNDLVYHNGLYHSLVHHGSYSNESEEACIKKINEEIQLTHQYIKEADYLLITLGSAHYYIYNNTNSIVANCHKIPTAQFTKQRSNSNEIITAFHSFYEAVKKINNNLKIIFSVSPVRYLRDGFIENNRSKSILIESVHQLTDQYLDVFYFPAYEIFMDDLREYRFCKPDFVHPSETAVEYILSYFENAYMDENTKKINSKIQDIHSKLSHRPIHPNSELHKTFLNSILEDKVKLEKEYPNINFDWNNS